jgi:hypothetical protein
VVEVKLRLLQLGSMIGIPYNNEYREKKGRKRESLIPHYVLI